MSVFGAEGGLACVSRKFRQLNLGKILALERGSHWTWVHARVDGGQARLQSQQICAAAGAGHVLCCVLRWWQKGALFPTGTQRDEATYSLVETSCTFTVMSICEQGKFKSPVIRQYNAQATGGPFIFPNGAPIVTSISLVMMPSQSANTSRLAPASPHFWGVRSPAIHKQSQTPK